MHQHPALTAHLADLHRQDLLADADRHRRVRHPERNRRILRRR